MHGKSRVYHVYGITVKETVKSVHILLGGLHLDEHFSTGIQADREASQCEQRQDWKNVLDRP